MRNKIFDEATAEKKEMTKEHPEEDQQEVHQIWIGERERIASFHEVKEYQLQVVKGHENYVSFLQELQKREFRFQ